VEQATLAEIARAARARGIERLIGVYRPTARNQMVASHYPNLGFSPLDAEPGGTTRWILEVASAAVPALPMEIRRPAESEARA